MSGYAPPLTHRAVRYTRDVMRLFFPANINRAGGFVVDLAVYGDASGKEYSDSPVLTLGGLVGRPDGWEAFAAEWASALVECEIAAFHMADYNARVKAFQGWTEEKRKRCLGLLIGVIERNALGAFAVSVPLVEFATVFDNETRAKAGGAYGIAAAKVFMVVADLARTLADRPHIAYVFEAGDDGHGQIDSMFRDNYANQVNREAFRLRSLSFQPKADYLPLQGADIVAYELNRAYRQQAKAIVLPLRWPMQRLNSMLHSWNLLTYA